MSSEEISVLAVGDVLIERDAPETIFAHTASILRSGDITFVQCEQSFSDKREPQRAGSVGSLRGTYSDPRNIPALTSAGFNVVSLASNCTLDWGEEAFLDTVARLRKAGLYTIGAGRDIAAAREPAVIERAGTKVAFLGYCSVGRDGDEAQENKPGYAPMRAHTLYHPLDYQPGTPPKIMTFPHKQDLEAMVEDVRKAKSRADVVIVSYHWGIHHEHAVIPMYGFDVAHAAIDAGADLILGHHPHILKAAEVYKGKVIFHSLGNFAFEFGPKSRQLLEKRSSSLREHYGFKPDPEYPTYPYKREARATFIAKALIRKGRIAEVSFIPCWVNKKAEPVPVSRPDPLAEEVREYMEQISQHQKLTTKYTWKGNEVVIS